MSGGYTDLKESYYSLNCIIFDLKSDLRGYKDIFVVIYYLK